MTSTPPRERICLLTGGGYPYRRDALSGWCRTLVEGLRRFRFELVTVLDREPTAVPAYPLPLNVTSSRAIALSRDPGRAERRRLDKDLIRTAAADFCSGLLGDGTDETAAGQAHEDAAGTGGAPEPAAGRTAGAGAGQADTDRFAAGLRHLADLTADGPAPLSAVPLADALADAWRAGKPMGPDGLPLPRLSMRDSRTAATLIRRALGALAVPLPEADLVHCVGGTTPLLTALAGRWRTDVPLLLTEARAPVARHKPAEERLSPAVRTVLRRFRTAVARAGYAEAGLIAPLSAYHHGWALRHGAEASKLVPVPPGIDPSEFPLAAEPQGDPAVVWAGSGGPDSGLLPLLAAFEQVAAAVPGVVLHLVGVTPAHEEYCAEQIERTGRARAIRLHPLPADPHDRYASGHVVAHVPGPADPPYRLVEAMMSGRAVVGVDIGPAAEMLGDAGVLVQPGDPAELAIAIVDLLRSTGRRRTLAEAARRRAQTHFTNDRVVQIYGALYADLAAPPTAPAFELALAIPAPRTEPPATLRWLARPTPAGPTNGSTA